MGEYIVKEWGHSLHVILNKKLYKAGNIIQVLTEEESVSLNLLLNDVEDLKTRIKILEDGN